MAKSRKVIRRRRRSRWSANIQEIGPTAIPVTGSSWFESAVLATNPTQNVLGVSNVYTVKNFDITFTIEASNANNIEGVSVYIMFVPQGMNVTADYNLQHPEYIMNYKYLGSPNVSNNTTSQPSSEPQQFQPTRVRTRLSRKLNTGDAIILFIKGSQNLASTSQNLELTGLVRWWTKSN